MKLDTSIGLQLEIMYLTFSNQLLNLLKILLNTLCYGGTKYQTNDRHEIIGAFIGSVQIC